MDTFKPIARTENLTIDRVNDETVVYDSETHRAHNLNRVADTVWRLCDGSRTVEEIADCLRRDLDPAANSATVEAAVQELAEAKLLKDVSHLPTRRAVAAGAALLVPVVTSMLIPKPAAAKSGKVNKPNKPKKPHPPHPAHPPKGKK